MHVPSYLHRNSYGIFYFRIAIPTHLRYTFQSREIKRSLRTLNRSEALRRARAFAVAAVDLFEQPGMTKSMFYNKLKTKVTYHTDGSITEEIETDPEKPEAEAIALKAHRESMVTREQILAKAASFQQSLEPVEPTPSIGRISISRAVEQYIQHIDRQEKWTDKTRDENAAIYENLIEMVGDIYVEELTPQVAGDVLDTLKALPPNRKKVKAYRNQTVAQLVAMKLPRKKCLAVDTVNKNLRRINQFCYWCVRSHYLKHNPFAGVSLKNRQKASTSRVRLSDNDVAAIVAPTNLKQNPREAHKFWLPILAAFSGCRLEELCQIRTVDVVSVEGLPCIRLTDVADDQEVKTECSVRTIPIHSEILRLGFMQFFTMQKLNGHQRLFPALKPDTYGTYSSAYSKHFTRYRRKCGILDKTGKCFHSFRHAVATKLKHADADPARAAAVIGHYDGENFTYRYYGEPYLPSQLVEIVEAIQYDTAFAEVEPWK